MRIELVLLTSPPGCNFHLLHVILPSFGTRGRLKTIQMLLQKVKKHMNMREKGAYLIRAKCIYGTSMLKKF